MKKGSGKFPKTNEGGGLTSAPSTEPEETVQQRIARQRAAREARDGSPEEIRVAKKDFWKTNEGMKKFWPRSR
jgi:hypothetical protein